MSTTALRALVRKDLQVFFSDRRAVLMSFAAPIAIASFFGFLFGGQSGKSKGSRIPIQIVDQDNSTIHLSFDAHNGPLHYRKSVPGLANHPEQFNWSTTQFGPIENTLGGIRLSSITYPRFLITPEGKLQYEIRIGSSGNGDSYLYEYEGSTAVWTALGRYIEGTTSHVNAPIAAQIQTISLSAGNFVITVSTHSVMRQAAAFAFSPPGLGITPSSITTTAPDSRRRTWSVGVASLDRSE